MLGCHFVRLAALSWISLFQKSGGFERIGVSGDCFVFDMLTLRSGVMFNHDKLTGWQEPQLGFGIGLGTETSILERWSSLPARFSRAFRSGLNPTLECFLATRSQLGFCDADGICFFEKAFAEPLHFHGWSASLLYQNQTVRPARCKF